jgi:hypothetical protein
MRYIKTNKPSLLRISANKGRDITNLENKFLSQSFIYLNVSDYEKLKSVVEQWPLLSESIAVKELSECR